MQRVRKQMQYALYVLHGFFLNENEMRFKCKRTVSVQMYSKMLGTYVLVKTRIMLILVGIIMLIDKIFFKFDSIRGNKEETYV